MNNVSKILGVSFFTNLFLTLFKIFTGVIFKSNALISDGIHSFSDLLTDIVAYFGDKLSRKPADYEHPYGHGKTEYLTNIIIGAVIISLSFSVIGSCFKSEIIIPSKLVILVSLITIISKYFLANFLIRKGCILENKILEASGSESKTDVISSIFVLISSVLMQKSNKYSFLKYADKGAAIIVGLFILKTGITILKENMSTILEKRDSDPDRLDKIRKIILNNSYVLKIDKLDLIKYGPYIRLNLEISMDGNISLSLAHKVSHEIEKDIKISDEKINFVSTHINSIE